MAQRKPAIAEHLANRLTTSNELQVLTGLSQSAISKQIKLLGDLTVRIPNGRQPLYALTCSAFGAGDRIPVYCIDVHGNKSRVADLRPLAAGGFFVERVAEVPTMLLGEAANGYFHDLPYYLQDLRPQGFIGRQVATEMASLSEDFPGDPRIWNTNHIGKYLIANGEDLPGNIIVGEAARYRRRRNLVKHSYDDYPALAQDALDGNAPGSSAGGEQPKFTTYSHNRGGHVLVKFSPVGDGPIATRWKDILITEHHATEVLNSNHFPAAETCLIERDGRLFLESMRFDRHGEYGRSSTISMQAIDAEYVGNGAHWPVSLKSLLELKLISEEQVFDACVLWEFGYLINNTDMHMGNLSLAMEGSLFRLLPAYDMCSMGFRPIGDEVRPFQLKIRQHHSRQNTLEQDPDAQAAVLAIAVEFWERVAADKRISDDFRAFLSRGNPAAVASRQVEPL